MFWALTWTVIYGLAAGGVARLLRRFNQDHRIGVLVWTLLLTLAALGALYAAVQAGVTRGG